MINTVDRAVEVLQVPEMEDARARPFGIGYRNCGCRVAIDRGIQETRSCAPLSRRKDFPANVQEASAASAVRSVRPEGTTKSACTISASENGVVSVASGAIAQPTVSLTLVEKDDEPAGSPLDIGK